jgi:hypothetical protein
MECSMKGLEKKKEGKKKAQKTLKEKRAEKHAKKSENACGRVMSCPHRGGSGHRSRGAGAANTELALLS